MIHLTKFVVNNLLKYILLVVFMTCASVSTSNSPSLLYSGNDFVAMAGENTLYIFQAELFVLTNAILGSQAEAYEGFRGSDYIDFLTSTTSIIGSIRTIVPDTVSQGHYTISLRQSCAIPSNCPRNVFLYVNDSLLDTIVGVFTSTWSTWDTVVSDTSYLLSGGDTLRVESQNGPNIDEIVLISVP